MQKTRVLADAVRLSDTPQRIRPENQMVVGSILQNQEDTAVIYVRSGGDGAARSYLALKPDGALVQDILPPQDELWAYSDTDGAILTLWEKYRA